MYFSHLTETQWFQLSEEVISGDLSWTWLVFVVGVNGEQGSVALACARRWVLVLLVHSYEGSFLFKN